MRLKAALIVCLLAAAAAVAYVRYDASSRRGGEPRQKPVVFVIASATPRSTPGAKAHATSGPLSPATPASSAAPISSAAPVSSQTPVSQTAAPASTEAPTAAPKGAPAATPTIVPVQLAPEGARVPEVVRASPDAPPQILAVSLSSPVVHAGEVVSGTVETSSNVASVVARIAGYGAALQKTGVGRFALSYQVPRLPFFLRKTYLIQVIARNTAGVTVSTAVPITVR